MKVLILTNPEHHKFVYETKEHHALSGNSMYLYDRKFNFDLGLDYDIGISFMYQHKVPAKEVNSHPWFNFHPAPLPEYKGRNLCYHAIMNGAKRFGASLHYMDEGYDTGDIIDVWGFDVEDNWNSEDLSERTIEESKLMFKHFFPRILAGDDFIRLPNTKGFYYKKSHPILEEIHLKPDEHMSQWIRAVTYKHFHPKLVIGGETYKIVKE